MLLLLGTLGVEGLQSKLKMSFDALDFFLTSGVRGEVDLGEGRRPRDAFSDGSSSLGDKGGRDSRDWSPATGLSGGGGRIILHGRAWRREAKGQPAS